MPILTAGAKAPDFKLRVTADQELSRADLDGKPFVLAFYPADWSPVCGDQMTLYNELLPEFRKHDAMMVGVSVDGVWCHAAYSKAYHLHFPLLSDFEPKGAMARTYGAYREGEGVCDRALFVVDRAGVIAWSYCSPISINPGAGGILDALEALTRKETARKETPHVDVKNAAHGGRSH